MYVGDAIFIQGLVVILLITIHIIIHWESEMKGTMTKEE